MGSAFVQMRRARGLILNRSSTNLIGYNIITLVGLVPDYLSHDLVVKACSDLIQHVT